jgi:hypothetical protein
VTLDFIWHLRGTVVLDAATTNEAALRRVERLLDKQRKPVTERGPDHVAFEDPLWRDPFGPNWLAMVIYDRGRFWIEGGRLHYDLRSLHGMVFCLLGAAMFFLFGLAGGGLAGALKFAALAFGWLYGMNVVLALGRVPGSIRKAVGGA